MCPVIPKTVVLLDITNCTQCHLQSGSKLLRMTPPCHSQQAMYSIKCWNVGFPLLQSNYNSGRLLSVFKVFTFQCLKRVKGVYVLTMVFCFFKYRWGELYDIPKHYPKVMVDSSGIAFPSLYTVTICVASYSSNPIFKKVSYCEIF